MTSDSRRKNHGFTLVELLVVIAIISILVTSSTVMVLQFMESRGLRANGRILEMVVDRARQLAQAHGMDHFVIIQNETEDTPAKLLIVRDLNRDGQAIEFKREANPDAGDDLLVDEYELSSLINVRLGKEEGAGPLVEDHDSEGRYWIRFGSDGTMNGSSLAPNAPRAVYALNRTWRDSRQPPSLSNERYDFLMTRTSGEKLFFDWEPAVGKIVSTYYKK